MPIRDFHAFLNDNNLIATGKLSTLAHTRIGIEGPAWLRSVQVQDEPFQVAMGGMPLTALATVRNVLNNFEKAAIKPVLVFNGVSLPRKDRPFRDTDTRAQNRQLAWSAYLEGNVERATQLFHTSTVTSRFAFSESRTLFELFREMGVEFMRGPYLPWAQLVYMFEQKPPTIHAVYGSMELLLFNIPRLITNIDFQRGTFQWVELPAILHCLGMTHEQFVDTCVFAGFECSQTFSLLKEPKSKFQAAANLIRPYHNGIVYLSSIQNEQIRQEFMEVLMKARALIQHHLVLDTTCHAVALNPRTVPHNFHECIGPRLPDDFYFFISQGIVSPQVANNLVTGILVESAPLADSTAYRQILSDLMEIRTRALGILSACLHRINRSDARRVFAVRWFNSEMEQELPHSHFQWPRPGATKWLMRQNDIDVELPRQQQLTGVPASIGLTFVAIWQRHLFDTRGPPVDDAPHSPETVSTLDEFVALILAQGLELLQYFNENHQCTVYGASLGVATNFPEEMLLVLELAKLGHITGASLEPLVSSFVPVSPDVALLTRVFSILPMKLTNNQAWNAPVDLDLLCFNCIVGALSRSLRNLFEMLALSLCLRHHSYVPVHHYTKLPSRLPFAQEGNTAMGIVLKYVLDAPAGTDIRGELKARFPCCLDPMGDLWLAFRFWEQVMHSMEYLQKYENFAGDRYSQFVAADQCLRKARERHQL